MMASYNILDEKWIPVKFLTDTIAEIKEISVKELIEKSHLIEKIYCDIPIEQYAIYRFLFAYIMDILNLKTDDQIDLLEEGKFDSKSLSLFQKYNQQYFQRFDLFDEEHPFYQRKKSEFQDSQKNKAIASIFQYIPTGNNAIFFAYSKDNDVYLSVELCLRALLTTTCFASVGGAGFNPNINNTPPYYSIILGKTLFETLILNVFTSNIPQNSAKNPPIWRDDRDFQDEKVKKVSTVSTLEGMTFNPRSVNFTPVEKSPTGNCTYSGKGSKYYINNMYHKPGRKLDGNWVDPYVAYSVVDDEIHTVRPQLGRSVWRDMGPLMIYRQFQISSGNRIAIQTKPKIFEQLDDLMKEKVYKRDELSSEIYIFESKPGKAKFYGWGVNILNVPKILVANDNAWQNIKDVLQFCEDVEYALKTSIKEISKSDSLVKDAQIMYWDLLEPHFKRDYLRDLAELLPNATEDNIKLLKSDFCEKLVWKNIGTKVLEEYIGDFDADVKQLKLQVSVQENFNGFIYLKIHPEARKTTTKKSTKKTSSASKKTSAKKTSRNKKTSNSQQTTLLDS